MWLEYACGLLRESILQGSGLTAGYVLMEALTLSASMPPSIWLPEKRQGGNIFWRWQLNSSQAFMLLLPSDNPHSFPSPQSGLSLATLSFTSPHYLGHLLLYPSTFSFFQTLSRIQETFSWLNHLCLYLEFPLPIFIYTTLHWHEPQRKQSTRKSPRAKDLDLNSNFATYHLYN